jgi:hypothetical protein
MQGETMRRAEWAVRDRQAIDEIIRRAQVLRLGLCAQGEPYIVPVCFGYDGQRVYVHSATEGRKLDILQRNPRVCFEIDLDAEVMPAETPCGWGMRYRSVMGVGRAHLAQDEAAKVRGLNAIMAHYGGDREGYKPDALDRVAVIVIEIESLSAKALGWD